MSNNDPEPAGSTFGSCNSTTIGPRTLGLFRDTNGTRPIRNGWKLIHKGQQRHETTIVGSSPGINAALNRARKSAATPSTVLLLGESGTGKEDFAKAIHQWSDRSDKPFVVINCAGLSRELLESELFGHEKGAFTGAHQTKRGKVEIANSGTILLDEIGDIAPEIQTKLLRFLQERHFERVGGNDTINVDVRIIAATNVNLEDAVKQGTFRLDLYYRLSVIPILLPPLRERRSDIPGLTNYFLERYCGGNAAEISNAALQKLQAHDWPGNVRELANVVERAVVLAPNATIDAKDITFSTTVCKDPGQFLERLPYHEAVNAFKKKVITTALEQEGSQVAAARALRLQKTYLCRLIKELQIR